MATITEREELIKLVKARLEQVVTIDIINLTREKDLGDQLSFKKAETLFVDIITVIKQVDSIPLEAIPHSQIVNFNYQLEKTTNILEEIKTFDASSNTNPVAMRDTLISQLEQNIDHFQVSAYAILTINYVISDTLSLEREKLNDTTVQQKLDATMAQLGKAQEAARKQSDSLLSEIQNVLDKATQAGVEIGVGKNLLIFKEESKEHEKLSELWLKRTIMVLFGIVVAGIVVLFIPPHDTATNSLIQFTVTKIVVLSVLFYGLAICTRNYKAHKHNSILNKHRQNALNTFETFTKAAGNDTQTKSAILLEATHTIFSNQQTGYLNNDNDSDPPNKIIEIFKNVGDKG